MFRNQVDSQSNVWNTVQSALSSKARQSFSIECEIVVQRQFDMRPASRSAGRGRRMTMPLGIGPERIFDLAFEH